MRIFIGQSGQVSVLVFLLGRRRHDLDLGDRKRALAVGGADAVRAGVAAADHHHVLAAREDRLDVVERLVGDAAVLLRQEIHGEMDAVELAAGDRQVARLLGAAGERDGVVLRFEVGDAHVAADMHAVVEGHAFGFHLRRRGGRCGASPS